MKRLVVLTLLALWLTPTAAMADLGQNYVTMKHKPQGKAWTCVDETGSYAWYCTRRHDPKHRVYIINYTVSSVG